MDIPVQSSSSATLSYLSFRNLILAILGYFVARVLYQIVYYRCFHPLSKFPGPFWGSVTRLWIASVDHHLHASKETYRGVQIPQLQRR